MPIFSDDPQENKDFKAACLTNLVNFKTVLLKPVKRVISQPIHQFRYHRILFHYLNGLYAI